MNTTPSQHWLKVLLLHCKVLKLQPKDSPSISSLLYKWRPRGNSRKRKCRQCIESRPKYHWKIGWCWGRVKARLVLQTCHTLIIFSVSFSSIDWDLSRTLRESLFRIFYISDNHNVLRKLVLIKKIFSILFKIPTLLQLTLCVYGLCKEKQLHFYFEWKIFF